MVIGVTIFRLISFKDLRFNSGNRTASSNNQVTPVADNSKDHCSRSSCLSASAQPDSCSTAHLFLLGVAETPFDSAVPVLSRFHEIDVGFYGSFSVNFS